MKNKFLCPRWGSNPRPPAFAARRLTATHGGRGFEPHRGHKNLFFTFYSIRVECEELFCKTNIKLLKLLQCESQYSNVMLVWYCLSI